MYLLFDIGATNMRIAVSHDGETILEQKTIPTPADFAEGMKVFKNGVREVCGDMIINAAAGGVPGILNKEKTALLSASNLKGWEDKLLKEALEKALDVPVYCENDAALAALGEAVFGAGKEKRIVAYFTVSTGIGGARVTDGRLDESAFGFEPGRQIVDGVHMLEYYISGNGIKKRYEKEPKDIEDPAMWEAAARWLAIGVSNAIALWAPDIFVLGGAVMRHRISVADVKRQVEELGNFPEFPEIAAAQLGDMSGLYGALALVKKKIEHSE